MTAVQRRESSQAGNRLAAARSRVESVLTEERVDMIFRVWLNWTKNIFGFPFSPLQRSPEKIAIACATETGRPSEPKIASFSLACDKIAHPKQESSSKSSFANCSKTNKI